MIVGLEGAETPFVRNEVYLHDLRLDAGQTAALPSRPGWNTCLYVFTGSIETEGQQLGETETALVTAPVDLTVRAFEPSVLVAFVLNPVATVTRKGPIGDLATNRLYLAMKQPVVP